ncbi:carbohydrate ABC transporter permease, partial [Fusobacterium mortiferum]|nr:sugar ABC transporter permease [Fusobacterium mortiferum]
MKREDKVLPYVLILPGVFIVVLTILYPILLTLIYSLQFYKLTKPYDRKIIGLQNYIEIFKNFDFYTTLINTGVIIGVVLVVGTILSFTIALILNRDTKLSNILTAVAIIPWALPPVVNGVIWKFIFYPEFGLINKILYSLGIVDGAILWLNNRYISLIILGIILSWRVIPFCSILILANIKAIPDDIFEAAQVDGAST